MSSRWPRITIEVPQYVSGWSSSSISVLRGLMIFIVVGLLGCLVGIFALLSGFTGGSDPGDQTSAPPSGSSLPR